MIDLKKEINFDKGCEECGIVEELLSTITNGKPMLLCKRCASINNSIVLPIKKEIKEEFKLEETKIEKKPIEAFTLSDLYERYLEMKAKKMQQKHEVLHEEKFLKDLEKEQLKDMDEIKKAIAEQDIKFDFSLEKTKKIKVRDLLSIALEKIKGKKKIESENKAVEEKDLKS